MRFLFLFPHFSTHIFFCFLSILFQCAQDSDCPSGICNRYLGTCALPDYQETEDSFLNCFISRMSSLTEEYLRENVFPESKDLEIAARESPEFLAAVRAAATHMDCVNTENALDFSQMTHKQLSVPSDCSRDYVLDLSPYTDYGFFFFFFFSLSLSLCGPLILFGFRFGR